MSSVQVQAVKNLVKGIPGRQPFQTTRTKVKTFSEIDKKYAPKPVKEKPVRASKPEKPKTKKAAAPKSTAEKKTAPRSKQFKEMSYGPKTAPVDLRGFENK